MLRNYSVFIVCWCNPETCTKVDPHSLGVNRVNVAIRNLDAFFNAFNIREGDKMYRPERDRVIIW